MYNFRARARAVLPGAVPAQGMRVRAVPAVSSLATPPQRPIRILHLRS